MKAVILAAGKGNRLKPLTEKMQKVMLPIGVKPVMEYAIETLSRNGINDIYAVVNHKKEDVVDYFGNGSRFNVKINYLKQENTRGTADSLRCAKPFMDENFVALNGDMFFHHSIIERLMKERSGSDGIVVAKKVSNPEQYGSLQIEDGKITKIIEKSNSPPSNIVNMGIYHFPRDIFEAIEETPLSKRGELELTDPINTLINRGFEIKPLITDKFCIDVGTKEDYARAKEAYKQFMFKV
ncbi:MAG: sugar phosphate nucleotidyltransferase [Nanoarchaeota archaeon]